MYMSLLQVSDVQDLRKYTLIITIFKKGSFL